MTYNDFQKLRIGASDCKTFDDFVAEEGGSVDFDDLRLFPAIYNTASFSDIRRLTGLTQKDFSAEYRIPLRTVESWDSGDRPFTGYLFDLLLFAVLTDSDL